MPDTRFKAEIEYKTPQVSGIDLAVGDILICKEPADDGWLYTTTLKENFPRNLFLFVYHLNLYMFSLLMLRLILVL